MGDGIRNIDKGNTEIMAESIRDLTGADLWKVESVEEYPYHYQECCDVAKEEIHNQVRPKVKNELKNIEDYDVIYIGGPVWWGHYPCPLLTVLEKLDFHGKTMMPFTTHEGSGLGDIMDDIQKICVGADIKPGLAIYGSNAKNAFTKRKLVQIMKQTAGRDQLGNFAPNFAHYNDDILFGENWNDDSIDLKTRCMITVVALMSSGITDNSLKYHLENAKKMV